MLGKVHRLLMEGPQFHLHFLTSKLAQWAIEYGCLFFDRSMGRTTSWSPKSECFYGPENHCSDLLRKMAALPKSNTFAD